MKASRCDLLCDLLQDFKARTGMVGQEEGNQNACKIRNPENSLECRMIHNSPAKRVYGETCTESSNLSFSATKKLYGLKSIQDFSPYFIPSLYFSKKRSFSGVP